MDDNQDNKDRPLVGSLLSSNFQNTESKNIKNALPKIEISIQGLIKQLIILLVVSVSLRLLLLYNYPLKSGGGYLWDFTPIFTPIMIAGILVFEILFLCLLFRPTIYKNNNSRDDFIPILIIFTFCSSVCMLAIFLLYVHDNQLPGLDIVTDPKSFFSQFMWMSILFVYPLIYFCLLFIYHFIKIRKWLLIVIPLLMIGISSYVFYINYMSITYEPRQALKMEQNQQIEQIRSIPTYALSTLPKDTTLLYALNQGTVNTYYYCIGDRMKTIELCSIGNQITINSYDNKDKYEKDCNDHTYICETIGQTEDGSEIIKIASIFKEIYGDKYKYLILTETNVVQIEIESDDNPSLLGYYYDFTSKNLIKLAATDMNDNLFNNLKIR